MKTGIDHLMATYAPPWYCTPVAQTVMLGIVFFWVFAAYTTIQFYAASTYGPELASNCVSVIYFTFTIMCLFAPSVTNKVGCRMTMFVGILSYAALVSTSLIYFLYGGVNVRWARHLVVFGGATLGFGASLLWTAQGRLILQYAAKAEELQICTDSLETGRESRPSTRTGTLMGLFWAIFQCSALVGGIISFLYFGKERKGSTALYFVFLGFILTGAFFTQLLLPPSMLKMNYSHKEINAMLTQNYVELVDEGTPLNCKIDSAAPDTQREPQYFNFDPKLDLEISHQTWLQEALDTLHLFFTKKMICLLPLFFYTVGLITHFISNIVVIVFHKVSHHAADRSCQGFNQPYQQSTFGNRFFTHRTIGAELIIFHLMEIIGAITVGRLLDGEGKPENLSQRKYIRKKAIICLISFILINSIGNIIAAIQEFDAKIAQIPLSFDIFDANVIPPSLAFACWGFADAQIQVYCYWLIRGFYSSGNDHARAMGYYKLLQSLGTSIGFYLIPTSRLGGMPQLACSSIIFVAATFISFCQLPS